MSEVCMKEMIAKSAFLGICLLALAAQAPALARAPTQSRAICGSDDTARFTSAGISPPGGSVAYGMNFDWWKVNLAALPRCNDGHGAVTTRGFEMLPHYDQPGVRQAVISELQAMRQSGFSDLRTSIETSPTSIKGIFDVDTDKDRAAAILHQYVGDVAAAGFRHLEIEYGTLAAGASCGLGRCLDAPTIERTVGFIVAVRKAQGSAPAGLTLSYDMLNEACLWPERVARDSLESYLRRLVPTYVAAFPQDSTTISCGARHFLVARGSIDSIYAAAGRQGPDYYEVHLYYAPQPRFESVPDAIGEVRQALANSRTPLIVGETGYGDARTVRQIENGLRDTGGGLRAVYFWPLSQPGADCNADMMPPYALSQALGW
jgi:hypothetical protein